MKPIYVLLIAILCVLQYQLWWAEGSVRDLHELKSTLSMDRSRLQMTKAQNNLLSKQIAALRDESPAIESRARYEHNMIKSNETYYQLVE